MFASFDTVDIWGWIILCSGDYLVLCRMFSGIPGLRPLDASSIPVVMTNGHICRYCQMSPGGSISPSLGPLPSLLVVLNLHPAPLPNASPSHSSFVNGRFVVVFFFFFFACQLHCLEILLYPDRCAKLNPGPGNRNKAYCLECSKHSLRQSLSQLVCTGEQVCE